MANKTIEVKNLVQEVLDSFSEPYDENIILIVFLEIEKNPSWLNRYRQLVRKLGRKVVNTRIGLYTKIETGLEKLKKSRAKESGLVKTYSKLGRK